MFYNTCYKESLEQLLVGFFVFLEVGMNVKKKKKSNQGNHVHAIEIQLVSTEATINVQGGEYVCQNCHELNLCKKIKQRKRGSCSLQKD